MSEATEADLDVFVARLEQLAPEGPDRRRDFIRRLTEASEPKAPEPEELPTNPEVRAEWLQDEHTNTREQLAKEREATPAA